VKSVGGMILAQVTLQMTAIQSFLGSRSFRVSLQDFIQCTVCYSPSVHRQAPTLSTVRVCTFFAVNWLFGFLYLLTNTHNFKFKNFRPSRESNLTLFIFSHKSMVRELNCFCVRSGFDPRNVTIVLATAELFIRQKSLQAAALIH
jgi:hypothetical protein